MSSQRTHGRSGYGSVASAAPTAFSSQNSTPTPFRERSDVIGARQSVVSGQYSRISQYNSLNNIYGEAPSQVVGSGGATRRRDSGRVDVTGTAPSLQGGSGGGGGGVTAERVEYRTLPRSKGSDRPIKEEKSNILVQNSEHQQSQSYHVDTYQQLDSRFEDGVTDEKINYPKSNKDDAGCPAGNVCLVLLLVGLLIVLKRYF